MALFMAYGILLVCYLLGGMGFNLLVWGRQREARVVGTAFIVMALAIRFMLIAPALFRLFS